MKIQIKILFGLVVLILFGQVFRDVWPPKARAQDFGKSIRPMGSLYNSSAVGSANVFAVDLAPSPPDSVGRPTMMRCAFNLTTARSVYLVEKANSVKNYVPVNGGTATTTFAFDWPMRATDESGHAMTYNFEMSGGATIGCWRADELSGAAD